MSIEIRPMLPSEALETQKLAKSVFKGLMQFFISMPKEALICFLDDRLVGGVMIKRFKSKEHTIGYIDYIFISKEAQGKGIGAQLFDDTMKYLYSSGCDAVCGIVIDDNVASWQLFENPGCMRVGLLDIFRNVSKGSAYQMILKTPYPIGMGMDYYLGLKETTTRSYKHNGWLQFFSYMFVNLLLFGVLIVVSRSPFILLLAFALLLFGLVVFGFLGTKLTHRRFKFRFNHGGFMISLLGYIVGAIVPMMGNYYPEVYEKNKKIKRDMALISLAQWLFLVGITSLNFLNGVLNIFHIMRQISPWIMMLTVIPVYPFGSYGGSRVYTYNRLLYFIQLAITLFLFIHTLFM